MNIAPKGKNLGYVGKPVDRSKNDAMAERYAKLSQEMKTSYNNSYAAIQALREDTLAKAK